MDTAHIRRLVCNGIHEHLDCGDLNRHTVVFPILSQAQARTIGLLPARSIVYHSSQYSGSREGDNCLHDTSFETCDDGI